MSDAQQTIAETCRCGGSINVTASIRSARSIVADWRAHHPCTDRDAEKDRDRIGGGASMGFASAPYQPPGHNNLEVRA